MKAMEILPFGEALLETKDLDPVYCALVEASLPPEQLAKWLVAYWCLYHCGAASWLSEQRHFWRWLVVAAENKEKSPAGSKWPRGAERRHWRGKQAVTSALHIKEKYRQPIDMLNFLTQEKETVSLEEVMERSQKHAGFGPWISFKIADMLDRVWGTKVNFSTGTVFMFTDPDKAVSMLAKREGINKREVIKMLKKELGIHMAPPRYDRRVNIQEIETILCKWKSHQNNRYPVGKDIREIRHGLELWLKVSETARVFLRCMPPIVRQRGDLL